MELPTEVNLLKQDRTGSNDLIFDYDKLVEAMTVNELHDKNPALREYLMGMRRIIMHRLETELDIILWGLHQFRSL